VEQEVEVIAVSPKTAQKMTGFGKTTVAKFVKNGTWKSVKIGKSRRILVSSIKEAIGVGSAA
jgi:hypothetical protein